MAKKLKIKDEPLDVLGAFWTAEVNLKAANALGAAQDDTGDNDLFFTNSILTALAIELYYKCIFAIENKNKSIEGHDLKFLFDELSQPSRRSIRQHYKLLLNKQWVRFIRKRLKQLGGLEDKMSFAFDDVLDDSRHMFVCWRYPFPRENRDRGGGMRAPFPLVHSARRRLVELQPDLAQGALVGFPPDRHNDPFPVKST